MTRWQQVEQRAKETRKTLKKCPVAIQWVSCGFAKSIIVNSMGQCSGCRNPDDGELEQRCSRCKHNEYFEEVG